jgi:hypothetical protein
MMGVCASSCRYSSPRATPTTTSCRRGHVSSARSCLPLSLLLPAENSTQEKELAPTLELRSAVQISKTKSLGFSACNDQKLK